MTLGIVDECRRLGLATKLLSHAISLLKLQWHACEILYLHVVDYNETALKFYLNNRFIKHKVLNDHYEIKGKIYDAVLLYRDISDVFENEP